MAVDRRDDRLRALLQRRVAVLASLDDLAELPRLARHVQLVVVDDGDHCLNGNGRDSDGLDACGKGYGGLMTGGMRF